MALTKNKYTAGNYTLEQRDFHLARQYNSFKNSQYGKAYNPALATIGINPSHMPRETFSKDPIEIENELFGINSKNNNNKNNNNNYNIFSTIASYLQSSKLKTIPEIKYFDRIPIIMPKPLVIENNQRPFPI
jgi:hypothetical protein